MKTKILSVLVLVLLASIIHCPAPIPYVVNGPSVPISRQALSNLWAVVTPEQFGATGNGVTDDSASVNACARFMESQNASGIATKMFCSPATTYLMASSLLLTNAPYVEGNAQPGWFGSPVLGTVNPTFSFTGTAGILVGLTTVIMPGGTFKNLLIKGAAGFSGAVGAGQYGLVANGQSGNQGQPFNIQNCTFYGFDRAMALTNVDEININQVWALNCSNLLVVCTNGVAVAPIQSCSINQLCGNPLGVGVHLESGSFNCQNLDISSTVDADAVQFKNCGNNNIIQGSNIEAKTGRGTNHYFLLIDNSYVFVSGNAFATGGGAAVGLTNTAYAAFQGNALSVDGSGNHIISWDTINDRAISLDNSALQLKNIPIGYVQNLNSAYGSMSVGNANSSVLFQGLPNTYNLGYTGGGSASTAARAFWGIANNSATYGTVEATYTIATGNNNISHLWGSTWNNGGSASGPISYFMVLREEGASGIGHLGLNTNNPSQAIEDYGNAQVDGSIIGVGAPSWSGVYAATTPTAITFFEPPNGGTASNIWQAVSVPVTANTITTNQFIANPIQFVSLTATVYTFLGGGSNMTVTLYTNGVASGLSVIVTNTGATLSQKFFSYSTNYALNCTNGTLCCIGVANTGGLTNGAPVAWSLH